ncbi:hypothetical protein T484DRAFT_1834019, partial [Baffinella frigidus]
EAKLRAIKVAKDADLARSEGRVALQEAAKDILKAMPKSDQAPWLRTTLTKIASQAGTVSLGPKSDKAPWLRTTLAKIASQAGTVSLGPKEIATLERAAEEERMRGKGAAKGGSEPCSVKLGGLPACATHRHAAGRRRQEAKRLLDHMLTMAHADFAKKRAAKALEAKRREEHAGASAQHSQQGQEVLHGRERLEAVRALAARHAARLSQGGGAAGDVLKDIRGIF